MNEIDRDEMREERITDEIIVDCYDSEEQALGWFYYLEDNLTFPFAARCLEERRISPLRKGERVTVTGMPSEEDCIHEMFVEIQWQGRSLGVPLAQLEPFDVDESTWEAIADWHYWVRQGYQLV